MIFEGGLQKTPPPSKDEACLLVILCSLKMCNKKQEQSFVPEIQEQKKVFTKTYLSLFDFIIIIIIY